MSANGYLTDAELEVVEDNDRLAHRAAAAFRMARTAWYGEGGGGSCIVEPAGAYRDYNTQYNMKHGIPSLAYWNLNPASKAGLASPGTSTHGTGTRFDATGGFNNFMLRRGRAFGYTREFGSNDPNHWKHDGITASANVGGATTVVEPQRKLAMTARYLVAPGPLWAGIDLVAFRSQGGVIVTDVLSTAEDLSRIYPFPAESVTRDELNRSVIAARLWVEQVVNPSFTGTSVDVDPAALAAELAPLLHLQTSDLTEAELQAHLETLATEIKQSVPPAVIDEMKKPGN